MGCRPIVLAGMDLSYSDQTHAKGKDYLPESRFSSAEQMVWNVVSQASLRRPGWEGGKVSTTQQMDRWIQWFEVEIGRTRCPVINATEGGVKIEGAKTARLEEAVAGFKKRVRLPRATASLAYKRKELIKLLEKILSDDDLFTKEADDILKWEKPLRTDEELIRIRRDLRDKLASVLEKMKEKDR